MQKKGYDERIAMRLTIDMKCLKTEKEAGNEQNKRSNRGMKICISNTDIPGCIGDRSYLEV